MCRNFGVRCRRKMDTPYIAPYNPYKFPRRMSEHHKLLPIWDLHFLRWIKLRSIGTKTDRFVPQICLSIPSSLAQLPAHQTSSSPIWLQLKSRDGLVDAHVIGRDLEEMKAERQADDSSIQACTSYFHKQIVSCFKSATDFWSSIDVTKEFPGAQITVRSQVPYSHTIVDTFREVPSPNLPMIGRQYSPFVPNPEAIW